MDATSHRVARYATAAGVAVLALASAVQMLAFLAEFGAGAVSDGVLGAYSLYILTTVFAQGCRVTASAAIGGEVPRLRVVDFAWGMVLVAVVLAAGTAALRGPLSHLIADGAVSTGVARDALPVFGLGMAAQFGAVAWAVILGQRGGLVWAAASLAGGGVVGVVGLIALLPAVGATALGWATVINGSVACLFMAVRTRGVRLRLGSWTRTLSGLALLARENVAPMFSTVMFVIAVGAAASVSDEPGVVSLFSLAYLAASYLCGILSWSTAIVDTVALSGDTDPLGRRLEQSVPAAVRVPFQVAVAVLAVGALLGPAVIEMLAPERAGGADPAWFSAFIVLLVPFTLATMAMNVSLPSWFTTASVTRLNRVLAVMLLVHIALCWGLGAALGVPGVGVAAGVAAGLVAWFTLWPAPGLWRSVAAAAILSVAVNVLAFGPAIAVSLLLPDGIGRALVAVVVGSGLFWVLLQRLRAQSSAQIARQ